MSLFTCYGLSIFTRLRSTIMFTGPMAKDHCRENKQRFALIQVSLPILCKNAIPPNDAMIFDKPHKVKKQVYTIEEKNLFCVPHPMHHLIRISLLSHMVHNQV